MKISSNKTLIHPFVYPTQTLPLPALVKPFITLLILLFAISTSRAQEPNLKGYIVQLNGDSLFGEVFMIDRYANSQSIYFQETGADSMERYYPHEIKAYGNIGGSRYKSFLP